MFHLVNASQPVPGVTRGGVLNTTFVCVRCKNRGAAWKVVQARNSRGVGSAHSSLLFSLRPGGIFLLLLPAPVSSPIITFLSLFMCLFHCKLHSVCGGPDKMPLSFPFPCIYREILPKHLEPDHYQSCVTGLDFGLPLREMPTPGWQLWPEWGQAVQDMAGPIVQRPCAWADSLRRGWVA